MLAACPVDLAHLSERNEAGQRAGPRRSRHDGPYVVTALVQEAVAYGDGWPLWARAGSIGQNVVKAMGTPAQKERWVGGIERGEMSFAAFALTEPHFGSDVAQVATTATRDGDRWLINGTKMYCSMGASADYVVVFATIDKAAGRHGIRAFVVEKGTPGFKVAKRNEEKLGIRCAETSELLFESCAVPLDHCLGWSARAEGGEQRGRAQAERLPRRRDHARHARVPCSPASASRSRAPPRTSPREWVRERRGEFTARALRAASRTSSRAWTLRSTTRAASCCARPG